MQVMVGPDGFLATAETPDYAAHVLLTEHLHERHAEGGAALERALPRVRKQLSKPELVALIRATHARIGWIAEHERELSHPRQWQDFLAQLARNLYAPSLPFEAADLTLMLDGHRRHQALWGFGPEELLVAFLETHDLTPELAAALRRFQAELQGVPGGMKYQSQAGFQVAVAHVHMLLWHDEGDLLDPKQCWSNAVRRDLRAMTGERKAHWKALFRHIKGNAPAKPAKGWVKEGEKCLAAVGHEDFANCFRAWLEPFKSEEPQRLSVAGSHVLRGLLWYAALTRDPDLAEATLVLLDAEWKAKRNLDKVMVSLVSVLETLPPVTSWSSLLRLQQEWPTSSVQVERFLKKTAAELGITEEELKARALLKPKLDLDEYAARLMEGIKVARAMVRRHEP
ncbi:MAG TPA: hypothetical protein VJN67_06905 [Stellaceae bacterium]|nr:hypothetical protein [Stellaceae bacterium]